MKTGPVTRSGRATADHLTDVQIQSAREIHPRTGLVSRPEDAIAVPGREFLIAHNYNDLFAFAPHGQVWRSERIALDGIAIDEVTAVGLTGQTYLPQSYGDDASEWLRFRLTFHGWKYDGPTYAQWERRQL